jgi:hypothetical protein
MKQHVITAINIFSYIITATVLIFGIWVYSIPDDDSPEGTQLNQCMETARTLAPDADTKLMIQRGCFGNYLISFGQQISKSE